MVFSYLMTFINRLGAVGSLYLGAIAVATVFTVGGIVHSLWSFIRGS